MVSAIIMALPSLPLFALSVVPEYWGRIYFWWGVIFASLSILSAIYAKTKSRLNESAQSSTPQFFGAGIIAWFGSLVGLLLINLSPLCLGQNNGDGTNDLLMCVFLTFIWAVFMSVLTIPLIIGAAKIALKVK